MVENASPPDASTLHDQLITVKAEVDALQIEAMKKTVPWYGSPSTLIAAFALLISLGSTMFTYIRNVEQDNWALRAELRSLILRLNDLPLKNYDRQKKYQNDALFAGDLAGLTNNENLLISTQAAEIMTRIPTMISGSEALTVAVALRNSSQVEASTDLLLVAEKGRNTSVSIVAIFRNLGGNYFNTGNIGKGREYFQKALYVFDGGEFTAPNAFYAASTHALTEMFWAQMEANARNCDAWEVHIGKANTLIEKAMSLTPNVAAAPNSIKSQIDTTMGFGCRPKPA